MNKAPQDILDTDTIAKSIWERISAVTNVGAKTATLALSELKLASTSAALALGIATFLLFMLLTLWALVLVMGFFALQQWGLGALTSVALLCAAQALVCVILALILKRLLNHMRFVHTRQAMRRKLNHKSTIDKPSEAS